MKDESTIAQRLREHIETNSKEYYEPIQKETNSVLGRKSTVNLNAVCGCYVGYSKWRQGLMDWYKEPDECDWEGVILADKEDWIEEVVSINCPKCNAKLEQGMDHFELAAKK